MHEGREILVQMKIIHCRLTSSSPAARCWWWWTGRAAWRTSSATPTGRTDLVSRGEMEYFIPIGFMFGLKSSRQSLTPDQTRGPGPRGAGPSAAAAEGAVDGAEHARGELRRQDPGRGARGQDGALPRHDRGRAAAAPPRHRVRPPRGDQPRQRDPHLAAQGQGPEPLLAALPRPRLGQTRHCRGKNIQQPVI